MAHVLVVDDALAVRLILTKMLAREGHHVTEAHDGAQGLMMIRATLHPMVVIMSHAMPVMTGARAMEEVASDPQLAAFHEYIFLTGTSYERSFAEVNKRLPRPAPFLRKPFTIAEITHAVNEAVSRIEARQVAPRRVR